MTPEREARLERECESRDSETGERAIPRGCGDTRRWESVSRAGKRERERYRGRGRLAAAKGKGKERDAAERERENYFLSFSF